MYQIVYCFITIIIVYYARRQHIKYRKQNTPIGSKIIGSKITVLNFCKITVLNFITVRIYTCKIRMTRHYAKNNNSSLSVTCFSAYRSSEAEKNLAPSTSDLS